MQDLSVLRLILHYADNALILGHRLSEWCGHGPILEQDIAITNISLDHIGQCRYLYDRVANGINQLPFDSKHDFFISEYLKNKISNNEEIDQDDLAYHRDAWEFRNLLLVEQPNTDWAYTIVRSFFYDTFMVLLYKNLLLSNDSSLAAIAEKSVKEAEYHKKWSSEWLIRLGDGTEVSHIRVQEAVEHLWPYTGELFLLSDDERSAYQTLDVPTPDSIHDKWMSEVRMTLEEATINAVDPKVWMHKGGKIGQHTENLGYILTELQYMQRAYPNMKW